MAIDFKEISEAGKGPDRDDWEMFAQEFLRLGPLGPTAAAAVLEQVDDAHRVLLHLADDAPGATLEEAVQQQGRDGNDQAVGGGDQGLPVRGTTRIAFNRGPPSPFAGRAQRRRHR